MANPPVRITGPFVRGSTGARYWPFVRWIRQWPVDTPHNGSVMRKQFACQDVIMFQDCFTGTGTIAEVPVTQFWKHGHISLIVVITTATKKHSNTVCLWKRLVVIDPATYNWHYSILFLVWLVIFKKNEFPEKPDSNVSYLSRLHYMFTECSTC